tara:strand:+ start:385 stop:558 length:174 start_codon:yes stop_codon:yes gene_type:complete
MSGSLRSLSLSLALRDVSNLQILICEIENTLKGLKLNATGNARATVKSPAPLKIEIK